MKKILFLIVGWLTTLSMHAQYNYFDHIEDFDSIGKDWTSSLNVDYGLYWRDSVVWEVFYGKDELTNEDVLKLKSIFLQGMTKSIESSHGESHLNGRDSIQITSTTITDIPQEASFYVMGEHVYGSCELKSSLDVQDKDGYIYFYLIQREPKFEQVEASTLRMDQTLAAILEETEPKVYEAVFDDDPQTADGFTFFLPGVTNKHDNQTQATIYEFAPDAKNKDLYDRLVATAYEHLDCRERFGFEHEKPSHELTLCVENPQKRGYIGWIVKLRGRLYVFRAEAKEGFCNVDKWYSDAFLRTQKVITPKTGKSTSRK